MNNIVDFEVGPINYGIEYIPIGDGEVNEICDIKYTLEADYIFIRLDLYTIENGRYAYIFMETVILNYSKINPLRIPSYERLRRYLYLALIEIQEFNLERKIYEKTNRAQFIDENLNQTRYFNKYTWKEISSEKINIPFYD